MNTTAADITSQPISNIIWIKRDNLVPNDYNPNRVHPPELDLLRVSILEDGWTKPIVVLPAKKKKHQIIDGFHRWQLSSESDISTLTQGQVPIVILHHVKTRHQQMCATIRHNRASGVHTIIGMAKIVRRLVEEGISINVIMKDCGMEYEEVARLLNRSGMPEHPEAVGYNQSWVPEF